MTLRTPNNVRRSMLAALDASLLSGTTPHRMRSTVASWIKEYVDVETASGQLGHRDTAVTEAYYLEHSVEARRHGSARSSWPVHSLPGRHGPASR